MGRVGCRVLDVGCVGEASVGIRTWARSSGFGSPIWFWRGTGCPIASDPKLRICPRQHPESVATARKVSGFCLASPSPSTCKPFGRWHEPDISCRGCPSRISNPRSSNPQGNQNAIKLVNNWFGHPAGSDQQDTKQTKIGSCKSKRKRLSGVSPIRDAKAPRATPTKRLHRDAIAPLLTPETSPTPSKHMRNQRMVRGSRPVNQKAPTGLWGPPPGSASRTRPQTLFDGEHGERVLIRMPFQGLVIRRGHTGRTRTPEPAVNNRSIRGPILSSAWARSGSASPVARLLACAA